MRSTLLIFLLIFPHSSVLTQTSKETVVAGALLYDYQGLEFGAAGDLEMAQLKFRQALTYMPYFPRALLNQKICNDARRGAIPEKLAVKLFKALNNFSLSDSSYVIESFNAALKENPDYAPGYFCRARFYEHLKLFEKAKDDHDRAVNLSPSFPLGYYLRGKFYNDLEEYNKAIADFTRVIEVDESYAPAFLERGIAYCSIGQFSRAIDDFEVALPAWPKWERYFDKNLKIFAAYLNRGSEKVKKQQYEEALRDLTRAVDLNPKFAEPYFNRGLAYLNLKSFDKAVAEFNEALDREPEYASAYYNRGLVLQKKRKFELAIQDYSKTIALQPEHKQAHYRLGEAYIRQNRHTDALVEFDKVLQLDPTDYWAYYWKALANDKLKNYPEAIDAYKAFWERAADSDKNHKTFARQRIIKLRRAVAK